MNKSHCFYVYFLKVDSSIDVFATTNILFEKYDHSLLTIPIAIVPITQWESVLMLGGHKDEHDVKTTQNTSVCLTY